jgi:hypothetical protein
MTFGMGISLYISKLKLSRLICPALTVVKYFTKPVSILSSVILFIVMGLTPFFDNASHLTKPRNTSMISILQHVVVTCLGMLLSKRPYDMDIFGLIYSKIVLSLSKNSMLAKHATKKYDHTLLLYTL